MNEKYELMRHALGVQRYTSRGVTRFSKPYRNHFVAGGDHVAIWDGFVAEGLAERTHFHPMFSDGMPTYCVTDAGRAAALAGITFKRRWGYVT